MTARSARRVVVLAALAALGGSAPAAASDAVEALALARAACGEAVSPSPTPIGDFVDLLRADAPGALVRACGELAAAGPAARGPATAVAEALIALHRLGPAQRLLEALRVAVDGTPASPEAARVHAAAGVLAIEKGENADALVHFERARAALEASGTTGTRRHAQVLVGLAQGWVQARAPGDLPRADAALDQAAALLDTLGLAVSRDMSDVLNLRAVAAYARQDLAGTVRWAQAELEMYRRLGLGDDPELLHTLTTTGSVLSQLGRFDEAEAAFREGLRIIDLRPDAEPAGQLGILNNLATLWRDRGRHDEALQTAERAVALAGRVYGTQSARMLTPLTVRAQAEWGLARYARARRSFEAALALAERHRASVGALRWLRLHDGLAAVQQALGDTDAARATLEAAMRTIATGDGELGYWRGRVLRSSAALSARAGEWPRADGQYAEAIGLIAPVIGAEHAFVTGMGAERCVAQTRAALDGGACVQLAGRLESLRETAPGWRFGAHAALALAADTAGRTADAREHHLQALAAAQSAGGPDPLWSAYDALAGHLRGQGERRLAVLAAKQAVEQIELMRSELGADARRYERGFLSNKLGTYRRLADWLTEDGRIDEALEVLRLLKREEFGDFVRGDAPSAAAAARLRTDAEERLLREIDGLSTSVEREAARVAAWRALLDARAGALDPRAARPVPRANGAGHGVAGELRAWIYPGAAHLNLVLEGPRGRDALRLAIDPRLVAQEVGRLLADLGAREDVLPRLQALHEAIARPILERARRDGARRLVLRLDGVLRYLPFAALHDGRRYLGERLAIEQRIDADGPRGASVAARATMLRAVGVTRGLAGMAPLRSLAHEVCGIVDGPVEGLEGDEACRGAGRHGLLPGSAWMNTAFTAERLARAAGEGQPGRRDLLHVGTHFVLRPGHVARSWLLLGDGERLYLDALARMSFVGQDLVTLAACETGLGGGDAASAGQEVDGLNTLVMRRGAAAVLASLWRVEDDSTRGLMLALYRELRRQPDPGIALQRAQAAVREAEGGRRAHPFHWAGFYLVAGGP